MRAAMESSMLDRSLEHPVAKGTPPAAQIPGETTPRAPEVRNVVEMAEPHEYRTILCCSIEKTSG